MSDDLAALLLALAAENAELRQQLATAQDMLMETAIDASHLHARIMWHRWQKATRLLRRHNPLGAIFVIRGSAGCPHHRIG